MHPMRYGKTTMQNNTPMRVLLIGGAGYIGSFLDAALSRDGYQVEVCDLGWRGYPTDEVEHPFDYDLLTTEQLNSYSHVLWFAGHSSVRAALADPLGSLTNNCINLLRLRHRMPPGTKLIYASTGSLYSSPTISSRRMSQPALEGDKIASDTNAYDISKFCFDHMARGFLRNFVGLRLGTLAGMSPNLRPELIFNAMNLSALQNGRVQVANATSSRSILFIDDLYRAVVRCIERPEIADGFINLSSFTGTVGSLATAIADFHGVEIVAIPDTPTYSFQLDTTKAREQLGIVFNGDLHVRCAEFAQQHESFQKMAVAAQLRVAANV